MAISVDTQVMLIESVLAPVLAVGTAVLLLRTLILAFRQVREAMGGGSGVPSDDALERFYAEIEDSEKSNGSATYDPSQVRYVSDQEYEANHGYSFATFNYMRSLEAESMAASAAAVAHEGQQNADALGYRKLD